jgi:tRNA/rRNA methyltransferase
LWQGLVNDRRFAGRGFKRQTPIGPHICDFVSFPLKVVLDVVPDAEEETAAATREQKRAWVTARGYRVIGIPAGEVEADVAAALSRIADNLSAAGLVAKP